MTGQERDDVTGTETTGHEWDGIKELNTPLPRWWLWTFYGTIVFAVGYMIAYPAWPLISEATPGLLGYSSRAELDKSLAAAQAEQGDLIARVAATPVSEIIEDESLARFARAGGASLFKVHCSQCHGTGATGSVGYPNLNDDEWIWGGTLDDIYATIAYGVRSGDSQSRFSLMPGFGTDGLLTSAEIDTVAREVAALSGIEGGVSTPAGLQLYADNCAGCHGNAGAGNTEIGAPSLNDQIWLFEGTLDAIKTQIAAPRHGVMPGWHARIGDVAVKELAVFVHSLGGGE